MEISPNQILEYLNFKGEKVLDEEAQNKLRDIVKCAVCFEIPKAKNLKVLTCGQGHHFCPSCYKNLKHCAICRGQFFLGRNFVVEELITQLGPSLGLIKPNIPPPEEPPKLIRGKFNCLHTCTTVLKAGRMLNHIRNNHGDHLLDNVRSNPYLKRFDWMFRIMQLVPNVHSFSVQISDMGLFTVIINISLDWLVGSLHSLTDSSNFQYKLTVKMNKSECSHEFSSSNCNLHNYNYDLNAVVASGRCLKIETSKLLELMNGDNGFHVTFSIWRRREAKSGEDLTIVLPENPILLLNDRKKRRNKQRNLRKSKVKLKWRELKQSEVELPNQIEKLSLDCPCIVK